jgi:hypothetical protein
MLNDLLSQRKRAQKAPLRITPGMVLAGLLLLVVLYLIGLWVYNAYFVSDEEKIRALVIAAARAAQERHPRGVSKTLSDDFVFHSAAGDYGKDDCHRGFVHILWNTHRQIKVRLGPDPIPVEVRPDRKAAEVTFTAHVQGKVTDTSPWTDILPPGKGTKYTIRAKLTENGWKFNELWIEKGD